VSDRYGPLPEEGTHLLFKIMLKVLARHAGVSRLDLKDQRLVLAFSETHLKASSALVDLILSEPGRFELTPDHVLKVRLTQPGTVGQLAQAKNILQEIHQRVNNQEN
jgi:transcription-repair coupling factor (superfamily II helicase)